MQNSSIFTTISDPLKRFIPISKQEIITDLQAATHWQKEDKKKFETFCTIFMALYHFKFHAHLEKLKHSYAPFSPNEDTYSLKQVTAEEKQQKHTILIAAIHQLLNAANYEQLPIDNINEAMQETSPYGLEVAVDLEEFSDILLYYRGLANQTVKKRTWRSLFLKEETFETPIYRRLFFLLKFKTEAQRIQELMAQDQDLTEEKARKQVQKAREALPCGSIQGEKIFLKLFQDIPRHDIEMLFPNQRVRLPLFDKINLAITGGGGTIGGIITTAGKIAVAANPFAIIMAFIGLVAIIFRQIMNIFNRRNKYMMTLAQRLYFYNLNNNSGVFSYLIDHAEEEECKEAILAYYFLHCFPEKCYTQDILDQDIQAYIQKQYGITIDFEVADALRKLREEGLLIEQEDGTLQVVDLQIANEYLDKQWDNFFRPAQTKT